MKKILILVIVLLSITLIYIKTVDKKVYYVSLGDEISLGLTNEGYYEKSFPLYIKEYLEEKNKLEIFIDDYLKQGYRITDIINDINNNKEIEESNKTIKNVLIKADLVTITIGTNDISSKINNEEHLTKIHYKRLQKNMEEIINDLDKLLNIIRKYCKEDIVLIGPNIKSNDRTINDIINYGEKNFIELSKKYNIKYISTKLITDNIYPTKEEYKNIYKKIKDIVNNNLLK